jgi:ribulose-5-phosphate 4-epimerase/fuculose-1-phosphate aldolase
VPGVKALRETVAAACRVLANEGLVRDIIGHVSARAPGANEMLIRCRGDDEFGLAFTSPGQVRQVDFDGAGPGLGGSHAAPLELPIHGEIYRARPEVSAVVHAHPEHALLCGIAGVPLLPVFGAYDPYAVAIAAAGVPVFPSAALIDTPALGRDLARTLGTHDACLMRGHGVTIVGRSVEEATIRAIKLEALAKVSWRLFVAGVTPSSISAPELGAFVRTQGAGVIPGGERWLWRHYLRRLEASGSEVGTA